MHISNRDKFLDEAKSWEDKRDWVGREYADNFKYIKDQTADWYIAIAAVCFTIGGIAISVGRNSVAHPALFWWGSVLLIANGVLIFFIRKAELDGEASGFPGLKQMEADLWTLSKISHEHANGNTSRADDFGRVAQQFINVYDEQTKTLRWWQWVRVIVFACMLDIVFALLLFPIMMLASQLSNYMHLTFRSYVIVLIVSMTGYFVYMVFQGKKAIIQKKKHDSAVLQIKSEVSRRS